MITIRNIINAPDYIAGVLELDKHVANRFSVDSILINNVFQLIQNIFEAKLILAYFYLASVDSSSLTSKQGKFDQNATGIERTLVN